jgi:hypothetical protein
MVVTRPPLLQLIFRVVTIEIGYRGPGYSLTNLGQEFADATFLRMSLRRPVQHLTLALAPTLRGQKVISHLHLFLQSPRARACAFKSRGTYHISNGFGMIR